MPSHNTINDALERAPRQACTQQQQQVRKTTRGHFTVLNQARTKPMQPFVFNKEKRRVQQKIYPIFVYTSMFFMNLLICEKRNMMEHCTLYKFLIIKNHMTLSLSIVGTVNCQFFTIRDISMQFG